MNLRHVEIFCIEMVFIICSTVIVGMRIFGEILHIVTGLAMHYLRI